MIYIICRNHGIINLISILYLCKSRQESCREVCIVKIVRNSDPMLPHVPCFCKDRCNVSFISSLVFISKLKYGTRKIFFQTCQRFSQLTPARVSHIYNTIVYWSWQCKVQVNKVFTKSA